MNLVSNKVALSALKVGDKIVVGYDAGFFYNDCCVVIRPPADAPQVPQPKPDPERVPSSRYWHSLK